MYAIPGTVIGIGYILAFNASPYFWTGTFMIIIVAYAFRRLPVGLRTSVASQKQVDPVLEEASLDLGASRFRTFTRITFPLLSRAFFAGVIFIFIRSMFGAHAALHSAYVPRDDHRHPQRGRSLCRPAHRHYPYFARNPEQTDG
jgi:iron(III) transport system permease protein